MMMLPRVLQQRSSWPSSFVTGLIGWNGFVMVAGLAFGYTGSTATLFVAASLAAVLEVIMLRTAFGALGLAQSVWRGAVWGTIVAGLLVMLEVMLFPLLRAHPILSLLVGLYVGAAVGAFLSYFHRDDRRIEAQVAASGRLVDYGRDAHWLDPFLYGAVSYLVAFLPRTLDLALAAAVVGSMTGVVAAGVSHFFLSYWHNASWTIPVSGLAGAALGAITGLLFRHYQTQLFLPCMLTGAIAGALTFLVTAAVGRRLALHEDRERERV
jgi:hypothetical protein